MSFKYILGRIRTQTFLDCPFRHLELNDLFDPKHFEAIIESNQVKIPGARNDAELIQILENAGYQAIYFPGTTRKVKDYLRWHAGKGAHQNLEICEGFGMTFRLMEFRSNVLAELNEFFQSAEFINCLAEKFDISLEKTYPDDGLQKYLDGYEISPHPDIRKKALTYMVNINPDPRAFEHDHHTHYMTFNKEHAFIQEYWKGNPKVDRCWVPWNWCETRKQQTANNSMVIFSPSNDTLHAVRARYDHLGFQRTQLYGNLWYHDGMAEGAKPNWRDYQIIPTGEIKNNERLKMAVRRSTDRLRSGIEKALRL